ncbi:MAG TPA: ATPase [Lachnospiraceae bacterium]|nr:ATPase [Lachnospiraceae bacterium]
MNIREAKEEIARSVAIYLDKNEFGEYNIPYMKQRPIFMVGAPGIGKTAIMEQIASELDIALVSYSMTHHTRQSALGLPFIEEKQFGGKKAMVSEYTMSEILASVYRIMEESGKREGILFLDEINCVSETLAPAMLLFLQYKTFGNRRLPEGWVIVTAGNPPQYNKSVKEFDVATLDRLKCFTVEEDFSVWKPYAYGNGIHAAVIAFLEINPEWFYSIRTTVDGAQYVTARGWEDLSRAISVYEKKHFPVDRRLIGQYITDTEVAGKFGIYYDLFQKYQSAYQVEDILQGKAAENLVERAAGAGFDERISLLGLILEKLNLRFARDVNQEAVLERVVRSLRQIKKQTGAGRAVPPAGTKIVGFESAGADTDAMWYQMLEKQCGEIRTERSRKEAANSLGLKLRMEYRDTLALLEKYMAECTDEKKPGKPFQRIKKAFDAGVKTHQNQVQETKRFLENSFDFMEHTWGKGQEMVLFMTELTASEDSMLFIEMWGCDSYFKYNQELLIYDVHRNLQREIADLGLE